MGILSWLFGKKHGSHGPACLGCQKIDQLKKDKDVGGLIEFLHTCGPDHQNEAVAALVAVTKKDLGTDPKVWRGWWRKQTENT